MRKHLVLILLFIVVVLCSCAQTTDLVQSDSDSALSLSDHYFYEFASQDELFQFIDKNIALRQRIAENYPADIKDNMDPENSISVQAFIKLPFTMELHKITYSGNFINYIYYLDGFNPAKAGVPDSEEIEINESETLKNSLSLSWGFTKDGKSGLEYFARENSPVVSRLSEDIYISDADNFYEEEPIGKMIYWTHDDYFFYSLVPERYVDEFIILLADNMEDLVSFISYEATSAMKIPDYE